MMRKLSLRLHGNFQVELNQQPVGGLGTNKTRALLAYLAVEQGKKLKREGIAALFWPEQDDKLAKQSLRQTLFTLKKAFGGEEVLSVSSQFVQISPEFEVWSDSGEIEGLAEACKKHKHRSVDHCMPCLERQERILALYQGEFLADLSTLDSNPFNEWYILRREQLHQIVMAANIYLGNYYERRGELSRSLSYVEKQLAIEPWREDAHLQAMRIYALMRERMKALMQYQTCEKRLKKEFDVAPTHETRKLAEIIRRDETIPQRAYYSVPRHSNECIGRQMEIGSLLELLSDNNRRLVTLLGPGGIGKSTLALALAEALRGLYQDGIAFITLSESDDIVSSIAEGLSLEGVHSEKTLSDFLRDRDLLLILDNFNLDLTSSQVIGRLIQACQKLQVVITSREILNLRGEHVFRLQGLAYPRGEALEQWNKCDAMRLMEKLIRQVNPSFSEDIKKIKNVRGIIERTDGHPLAIEFAAGYIAQHDISELDKMLEEGLDFNQDGYIDLPDRHRSLEAIFDHSWLAMEERERVCLTDLAVFRGGITLEAVRDVLGINQAELDKFVGKSLLMLDDSERYCIHGVTRQFILERMSIGETVREGHARYYANLPKYSESSPSAKYLAVLKKEITNYQDAWEWALRHTRYDLLKLLVPNVLAISLFRGPLTFGEDLFLLAKAEVDLDKDLEFKQAIYFALAKIYLIQMRFNEMGELMVDLPVSPMTRFTEGQALAAQGKSLEARPLLEEALEMNAELENKTLEMDCLRELGNIANRLVEHGTASSFYQRCLRIAHQLGDKRNESAVLNNWASVDWDLGNLDIAEKRYQEALQLYRELGNRIGEAKALNNLSNVSAERGDLERSLFYGLDALAIHREMGNIRGQGAVLNNLGATYHSMREYDTARSYYQGALENYRLMGNNQAIAETLANLSLLDCVQGKLEEGRGKAKEAISLSDAAGDIINLSNAYYYLGRIDVADGDLARAEASLNKAYELRQIVPHPGHLLEIEAELMNIAYQRRENERAKQLMGEVLAKMDNVDSANDPERVLSLVERLKSRIAN
ncbi:MAG: tetratricopeptide repeat protein [Anaerolineaceae bacterium]|nr:tetratricopeptide repeat protein [Anaerolineaceae bacterium]